MVVVQEDATEGGGVAGHLGKILSRSNTGGVVVWEEAWVLLVPMAQRLEVFHVGLLRQVMKLKAKTIRDVLWW